MRNFFKKLAVLVLSAGMTFAAIPVQLLSQSSAVHADETETEMHIWDGTADTSWYDSEETELHISTPEQLAGLAKLTNAGQNMKGQIIVLDDDIYLNDISSYDEWGKIKPENEWVSISGFYGEFDGEGHIIKGLYGYRGLFGSVIWAQIHNINLEDLYILQSEANVYTVEVGGIVDSLDRSVLYQCNVEGYISVENSKPGYDTPCHIYVGGICGKSSDSKISYCTSNTTIEATGYEISAGGICGYAGYYGSDTECSCCINYGNISVNCESSSSSYVGGISGRSSNTKYCINKGNIISNGKSSSYTYSGGIIGLGGCGSQILNCYNTGDIKNGEKGYSAGICGCGDYYWDSYPSMIKNVYNTGSISGSTAVGITGATSTSEKFQGFSKIENAYYLSGTAVKGVSGSDPTIAKSDVNMRKEEFVDNLGDAFYYVEGEYPKLAFEVGRTVSCFDQTNLSFAEFGETKTLTLDTTYLGTPIWISSDTSVATVNNEGVVTAVGNGTVMIYALCDDSKAACSVSVGYDYYLSDNEITLKKGRVHSMKVYSASTGKEISGDIEWRTSDESVVSIEGDGIIATNAVGTAYITAKYADIELNCIVFVYEYTAPIIDVGDDEDAPKLSETEISISMIETKQLFVSNYDDSIVWVSSNTSITKVNSNGLLRPVSEGSAAVYALLSNGKCLKADVTVTKSDNSLGDADLDGSISVSDAVTLYKYLHGIVAYTELEWKVSDMNQDGSVDVFDLVLLKRAVISQ